MPRAFSPNASQRSVTTASPRGRLRRARQKYARKLLFEHLEDRRVLATIYSANMDSSPGWTTSGQWAFGDPTGGGGTSHGYADPSTGYTGSNVYGVNLYGDYSTAVGGPYYLTTGAIDCSGYTGVNLQFRRWLNTDYSSYVTATVDVSSNGTTWNNLYTNSSSTAVTDSSWQLMQYDIGTYADNRATVYLRWGHRVVNSGAYAYSGWNIDDVTITGTVADSTPPTVTGRVPAPNSTLTATSVNIDVTFSEAVKSSGTGGVEATDLVVSGAAATGATVGTPTNTGGNTWRFPVSGLMSGTLNASLAPDAGDVQDLAGNNLANLTWSYAVDVTPPTVAARVPAPGSAVNTTSLNIDVSFSEPVKSSGAGGVDATDLVLSGTAASGAGVGTPTNTSGNTWRFPVSGLAEGTLNVNLAPDVGDIQDLAGNNLANVTWSYTVDRTPPTVADCVPAPNATIGPAGVNIDVTFFEAVRASGAGGVDATDLVVSGTAATGASVGTPTKTTGNTWRFPLSGLSAGTVDVNLAPELGDVQDLAGNNLAPLAWSYTVDATPPTVAGRAPPPDATIDSTSVNIDVAFSESVKSSGTGGVDATDLVLSGPAAAGATIGTPSNPSGDTWRFPVAGLVNGILNISLAPDANDIQDLYGNALGSLVWSYTVALPPGTPPTAVDLLAVSDSGVANSDDLTNLDNSTTAKKLQFLIAGTSIGASVTLYADGTAIGSAVAAGSSTTITSTGTYDLTDGSHTLTARQTEIGKSASNDSPPLSLGIDTVAPAAPAAPDLQASSDSGVSSVDNVSNDTTPAFDLAAGPYFRFYRATTRISGDYESGASYSSANAELDGTYSYKVSAVDAAGNESALSGGLSVTIDTAAPATPAAPDLDASSDTGLSNADNLTSTMAPGFVNLPGPYFRLFRNGVQISGNYQQMTPYYTVPSFQAEGVSDYSLQCVDAAGNVSPISGATSVTVDTVAPPAPTAAPDLTAASDSGISDTDNVTRDATPTFGVDAAPYFRVFRGAYQVSSSYELGNAWLATTNQPDGTYAFTVKAVDAAGNLSAASPALTVTIDTWAPSIPGHAGSLDTSFSDDGKVTTDFLEGAGLSADLAYDVAIQSDGKIVVAGHTRQNGNSFDLALVRYAPDGALDASFGSGGRVTTDLFNVGGSDRAYAFAFQSDGKIVVAGASANVFALARYHSSGSLDSAFGHGGYAITNFGGTSAVRALAIQADGKILAVGYGEGWDVNDHLIARYNINGTLDTTFGSGGKFDTIWADDVWLQPDGRIVLAGASGGNLALARHNSNGTWDSSFGTSGVVTTDFFSGADSAYAVALQPDGKIVVAGRSERELHTDGGYSYTSSDFALARYDPSGALDMTFGSDGLVTLDFGSDHDCARDILVQSDGKILVVGESQQGEGSPWPYDFALARFLPDGSLDAQFGSRGRLTTDFGAWADFAQGVALQSDGKIVAAGFSQGDPNTSPPYYSDMALARYSGEAILAAPDLQASTDTGVSDTDNITDDSTPTFDLALTDTYFRFYRDGLQISGNYETGIGYTPAAQADGSYTYSYTSVDTAGNESAPSGSLAVIISLEIPTLISQFPAPDSTIATATVSIDLTFSKPVLGVDATDLVLTGTATSAAAVGTPTDRGGNTWRFPVSGLNDGTLLISLAPDTNDIEDAFGHDLATQAWSYLVAIPPAVSVRVPAPETFLITPAVNLDITFSEAVQGVEATDLALSGTAGVGASVAAPVDLGGNTWRFPVSGMTEGGLTVSLAPDAGDIEDFAGNDLANVAWSYVVDITPPSVTERVPAGVIRTASLGIELTFSEYVQGVDATDLVLTGTAAGGASAGSPANVSGNTWQFPISGLTEGALFVSLAPDAGDIRDLAGHELAAQSWQYSVELAQPQRLFFDDFPTTTLNTANWTTTGGSPVVSSAAVSEPSAPYALQLDWYYEVRSRTIDLTGMDSAALTYCWQRSGTEAGDDLYVEYWNGTTWQPLRTQYSTDGSPGVFYRETVSLPSAALWAGLRVRFLASGDLTGDYWYLDDVELTAIEVTPPTVTSRTPAAGATLGDSYVNLDVTFSEFVSGVDATDMVLAGSAAGSATIATPTNISGNTWRFPVSGLGDGPLDVGLAPDRNDIEDRSANDLVYVEWTYTVADVTSPTLTNRVPAPGSAIQPAGFTLEVTFSERVVGMDATDLVLTGSAATDAAVGTPANPSGNTWRFPISGLADGALNISLAPNTDDVEDPSGNDLAHLTWSYTVDTIPPTVTNRVPAPGYTITTNDLGIEVAFSETAVGVDASDLVLTGTAAGNATVGTPTNTNGNTWRFPISGLVTGTLNVSLAPHVDDLEDAAGNDLENLTWTHPVSLVIVPNVEDFETSTFTKFPWVRSGNANWTITSSLKHGGWYSAKSGTITHGQSTTLQLTASTTAGNITFWRNVSSETSRDFLRFYVDGVQQDAWSGSVAWGQVSYAVTLGSHTFRWTYSKNATTSSGSDAAWIDDIVFPMLSDTVAPTGATCIPVPGSTLAATSVNVDVTFSEPVLGVDASDLVLSGTAAAGATVGAAVNTAGNTWRFPVSGLTTGGLNVSLAPQANDIEDLVGNDLANLTWSYTVDVTPPTVTNRVPAPDATITGSGINLDVTFSESVTGVDATDLVLTGTAAGVAAVGSPTNPSGNTWRFPVSGLATGSLNVSLAAEANAIEDPAGNDLASMTWGYTVQDETPPTVTGWVPASGAKVASPSVNVDVTFSEVVLGVDAADLLLGGAASTGATVGTPTDLGGNTWRFPISGLGDGPLSLSLAPEADAVEDPTGNDLATAPSNYTVDLTPPTVSDRVPVPNSVIATASFNLDVTFSEVVTGVDATDLALSGSASGSAVKGTPTNLAGTTWRFPISGLVTGTLNISLAPDANDLEDLVGHDLGNIAWSYTVDRTPPTVISRVPAPSSRIDATTINVDVTFSEAVAGVDETDLVLSGTAAGGASVGTPTNPSGHTWRFPVTGLSEGTVSLSLAPHANDIEDLAGNDQVNVNWSYTVDLTPPAVTQRSPVIGSVMNFANVDVTFSEAVQGVDSSDLVLTGTAAAAASVGTPTNTSGNTWRFSISGLTDGALTVSLAPDANDIQDLAGNDVANLTWSYPVDLAYPHRVFFDDFPEFRLNTSNWPFTSGLTYTGFASNPPSTPYSLDLSYTDEVRSRAIDLSGFFSAELKYYWQRYSTEYGDNLYVDYWNGTSWQRLQTHYYYNGTESVFYQEAIPLPAAALHAGLQIRFLAACGDYSDSWYLDNVEVAVVDLVAPSVISAVPASGATVTTSSADFDVTFSKAVQGVDATDLVLDGTAAIGASVGAPTNVGGATWRFPVSGLTDGVLEVSLAPDASDVENLSGINLAPIPPPWNYAVAIPPAVIARLPAPGTTLSLSDVNLDVTFSEVVQGVDLTDLVLAGTAASGASVGTPIDQGGNTWRFPVWGLTDGALDISLAPDANDIEDLAGHDLDPRPTLWSYAVDLTPPALLDRVPAPAATITTAEMGLDLTFSEPVQGVDAGDLVLTGSAAHAAVVGTPTDRGGNTWRFPVSGLDDGMLNVSLAPAPGGIEDLVGHDLAPVAWSYPVAIPPSVIGQVPAPGAAVGSWSVDIDVTFSEPILGLDATDLVLSGPAAVAALVGTPADRGGNTWRFPVTRLINGPLNVSLAPDTDDIQDLAGNSLLHATWSYTVSFSGPTTVLEADFEDGAGGYSSDGFTTSADPDAATNLWHATTHQAASATHSQYYGREFYRNYATGSRNAGNLDSPTISLGNMTGSISLSFNYRLQTEGPAEYDTAQVQISDDGGSTWNTLASRTDGLSDTLAWKSWTGDISSYAGSDVLVRFNFDTVDDLDNAGGGWYIDDVRVTWTPSDSTPPSVIDRVPASSSTINTTTINLDVTFSEPVKSSGPGGVDATDLVLSGSAAGGASVGVPTKLVGNTWRFPVTGLVNGTLDVNLAPDADDIQDLTGHPLANTAWNYSVHVLVTVYSATMDTNPGWTFDAGSQWAYGTPTGNAGDPTSGHTGANVVGYNLAGAYPNNLSSTLYAKTPAINCSSLTGVTLSFWRWLGVYFSFSDTADIEVSNNGSTWTTVWYNSGLPVNETAWSLQTYDISAVADNQPTVYIRWGLGPTDHSYAGWNIDDVSVVGMTTDITAPSVTSRSPTPDASITSSPMNIDVTFSEPVRSSGSGAVDATDLVLSGSAASGASVGTPTNTGGNTWRFPVNGLLSGTLYVSLAPDFGDIQDTVGNSLPKVAWTYAVAIGTEGFETGNFSSFPWTHSGNAYWTVVTSDKHAGTYSARSGAITQYQSTALQVTLSTTAGNVSFWRRVSTQLFDDFEFYIDGALKTQISGSSSWSQESFPVAAGSHTFRWLYEKSSSTTTGNNTVWIDDIVFPTSGDVPGAPSISNRVPTPGAALNSSSANVDVTFSEQVKPSGTGGVDATDMVLSGTAAAGASVGIPLNTTGRTWRFPVTGLGTGTLNISLAPDANDIEDLSGNDLGNVQWTYPVDVTPPAILSQAPAAGSQVGTAVTVEVTFSEAVTGVDSTDLELSGTAAASASVGTPTNPSGTTWRFPVTGLKDGSLRLSLAPQAGDIRDLAGHNLASSNWEYTAGGTNRVYVLGYHSDFVSRVDAFTRNGSWSGTFAEASGLGDSWTSLAIANREMVIARWQGTAVRYRLDGTSLGALGTGGHLVESDSHGNVYFDMDADAMGNLYEIGGDEIIKYGPTGTLLGRFDIDGEVQDPTDLAIDEVGQILYIAEGRGYLDPSWSDVVKAYDISRSVPVFMGAMAQQDCFGAEGLSFDPQSGHLFVALYDTSEDAESREVTPVGTVLHTYASGLSYNRDIVYTGQSGPGDVTAPAVIARSPNHAAVIRSSSFDLDVTFSEAVQGVDATDLVLSGVAAADATIGTPTHLGGNTWRFPLSGLSDGTLSVSLGPDANDIEDLVGYDLVAMPWTYTIETGPPWVTGTTPDVSGGTGTPMTTALVIEFSEAVVGADAASNYELRRLGADGLLGTADDEFVEFEASASGNQATLRFALLTESVYRLTVRDAITDPFGRALDGDGDGVAGGSWIHDFVMPTATLFATTPTYPSGSLSDEPWDIATADFNGDGNRDLAVANWRGDNVGVMLGDGRGGFGGVQTFTTTGGDSPDSITVGDFDGDGRSDVAVCIDSLSGLGVAVFLGDGHGGLGAPTKYAYLDWAQKTLVAGDFNGDGRSDLAGSDSSGTLTVLLADASGGFAPSVIVGTAISSISSVGVGDFNADGNADLAAASGAGKVQVLLGGGDGNFAGGAVFSFVGSPSSLAVADFDGDGKIDVAVGDEYNGNVKVLRGDGNGGFVTAATFSSGGSGVTALAAADVDGDGDCDIASITADRVAVLVNDGGGGFSLTGIFASGGTVPSAVTADDFNGDGQSDLAVANLRSDTVGVLLATGGGGFAAMRMPSLGGASPYKVTAGDLNADGSNDLAVITGGKVAVLLNDGQGNFSTGSTLDSGGTSSVGPAIGDLNGDGKADLAVTNSDNDTVGLLFGDGAGGFAAATTISPGGTALSAVAVGDFNGDRKTDLAVTDSGSGTVAVLLGDGAGGFPTVRTFSSGDVGPVAVVVGDFNRDGKEDLGVANNGWIPYHDTGTFGTVRILLGDGNGWFTPAATVPTGGSFPLAMTVGDFNDDSISDLAVAHYASRNVAVLLGNGSGGFASVALHEGPGIQGRSVAVGDFNLDGHQDLVAVGSYDGPVRILLGNGAGDFSPLPTFNAGGTSAYSVSVSDLNGDGKADLAVANGEPNSLCVLLNRYFPPSATLASPHGFAFDVQMGGFMAGQQIQGTNNAFDGLNRLQVGNADYAPEWGLPVLEDGGRTLSIPAQTLMGLNVHREITVPNTGDQDFVRTVDVFTNPTGNRITTTVRIIGNLGSDAATTVFGTSDGNGLIETTDQWLGTDDADGLGSPAMIQYIHGPMGLRPTSVVRTGDNIEWTYNLSVPAGQTARLAHFTIVDEHRADAEAAANALVTASGFGGQAAAFLTQTEVDSVANFAFNGPPTSSAGGPYVISEGDELNLDGSASSDPDGDPLTYSWDVNGDGTFGDATGVEPTLTWAQLQALGIDDGPLSRDVRVRVSDGQGHEVDSAVTLLTVNNTAPEADFSGPPATGLPAALINFTITAAECSTADQANITYEIQWGDGTSQTVTGPASGVTVGHVWTEFGSYAMSVTATDKDQATGAAAAHSIQLTNPGGLTIDVDQFTGNENNMILVTRSGSQLVVTVDGVTVLNTAASGLSSLTINGQAGDDTLTLDFSDGSPLPPSGLTFHGGDITSGQNDTLVIAGGTFSDVIKTCTGPHDGTIQLDDLPLITYTGLAPVDFSGDQLTNLTINLPAGADHAVLEDAGDAGDGLWRIRSTDDPVTFEQTVFPSPSNSLTINANDGDTVTVVAFDSLFNTPNITLGGSGGGNRFVLGAAERLPDAAALTLLGDAELSVNGLTETVGSLSDPVGGTLVSLGAGTLVTGGNHASTTYTGMLTGAGGLTKTGNGVFRLAGADGVGAATVEAGTLLINGTLTAAQDVQVHSGGTLGGTGTIVAYGGVLVSPGGTLDPGELDLDTDVPRTGQLTVNGDVEIQGASGGLPAGKLRVQLGGTTPGAGGYDQLVLNGSGNLNGTPPDGTGGGVLEVQLGSGYSIPAGAEFVIISNDLGAQISTRFLGLAEGAPVSVGGVSLNISYLSGSDANDVTLARRPAVQSVVINAGLNGSAAQRSMVKNVTVTFDTLVTIESGAFALSRRATDGTVTPITTFTATPSTTADGKQTVVTLTFPKADGFVGGSLADGNYLLTIDDEKVHAGALNLAGDGSPNGDYCFGDEEIDKFFRLFGDGNGDRLVDATTGSADLALFAATYGKRAGQTGFNEAFDYDGDGDVDGTDLSWFRAQRSKKMLFVWPF